MNRCASVRIVVGVVLCCTCAWVCVCAAGCLRGGRTLGVAAALPPGVPDPPPASTLRPWPHPRWRPLFDTRGVFRAWDWDPTPTRRTQLPPIPMKWTRAEELAYWAAPGAPYNEGKPWFYPEQMFQGSPVWDEEIHAWMWLRADGWR